MPDSAPQPINRLDYAPPPFLVERVDLDVDLGETETRVLAKLALRRNPASRPRVESSPPRPDTDSR